jgi:hypothetical protein
MTSRLVGYGTKDKTVFGKTYAEVARPLLRGKGDAALPGS